MRVLGTILYNKNLTLTEKKPIYSFYLISCRDSFNCKYFCFEHVSKLLFPNFQLFYILHIKDHGNHCIHGEKTTWQHKKDEPYRVNHGAINLVFPKTINFQNNFIPNNCEV